MSRPWICATCNRSLQTRTDADGSTMLHSLQDPDDHPVVPVQAPEGYAGGRCDFCSSEPVTHVVPARDFAKPEVPGLDLGDTYMSRGDWAACAMCAELVTRNDWTRILIRTRRGWKAAAGMPMPEFVESMTVRLHRRLRANITGAPRPIGKEDTP